jgi:ribosome-binding protein aMBF1 (putative translation factor)
LGIAQRSIRVKFKQKKGPFSSHNQLPQSVQSLGDWIKAKRIGKKLTPGHLALKMGIAATVVCAWEAGESRPSEEQIKILAKTFGETFPPP